MDTEKPSISKTAFWDTDFEGLDYQNDSVFIISQVFNYGLWDDIISLLKFYSAERVKKEITAAPWLKDRVLSFWATYFKIPPTSFQCYKRKQSVQMPWAY